MRVRVAPVRGAAGRGALGHAPGGLLARVLAHRAGDGRRRPGGARRARCCSTAPRASARCRSTSASWAVTTTRPPARSGSAGRSAAGTSTCAASESTGSRPAAPGYQSLSDTARAARPAPQGGRRALRRRAPAHPPLGLGAGLARTCWPKPAWTACWSAARPSAERLAGLLAERGLTVAPRGRSTLVSWEAADNEAESERLLRRGCWCATCPGTPYVRASVGAWTSEEELERLAEAAALVLLGHHDDAEHHAPPPPPRRPSSREHRVGAGGRAVCPSRRELRPASTRPGCPRRTPP